VLFRSLLKEPTIRERLHALGFRLDAKSTR
jgi:hypothetical protein